MPKKRNLKGGPRWYTDFYWRDPDTGRRTRIRRPAPVNSKRGAEEFERILLARLMQHGALDPVETAGARAVEAPTVAEFAQDWMRDYVRTNNKPSTVQTKESALRLHLLPFFGHQCLDAVKRRDIERYKGTKIGGLSAKTVNNHLGILHRLLQTAIEWEIIESMPHFQWLKTEAPPFDFLTAEEGQRLLESTRYEQRRVMILTALRTGMRVGEMLALRWDHVDFTSATIHVARALSSGQEGLPKGNRTRHVPMSDELAAALRGFRHLRGPYVFCEEDGRRLTRNVTKRWVKAAARRAGLRAVSWHVLRHSFASQLVMAGVPLKAVQELLGHATIEMTMRYAHLAPSVLTDAVRVLDGATPRGGSPEASGRGRK